ncbi:hypothetical protein VNO80_21033 [Phaseolus coccineus]|uniref:Uncharacterized protein n=1 Tax=Phaseolus coccineus TaxID=3886 RepID=A0AAN9M2C3_PHACN
MFVDSLFRSAAAFSGFTASIGTIYICSAAVSAFAIGKPLSTKINLRWPPSAAPVSPAARDSSSSATNSSLMH